MNTSVRYQVVFSGRLRKGCTTTDVKRNLATRMRLPKEKIDHLLTAGRAIVKQTPSLDEAKRLVMQLAAIGVIATIEPKRTAPVINKPAAATPPPAAATKDVSQPAVLRPFNPLRLRFLLKPLLVLGAAREVLLNLLHAALLLALFFGVLVPSLSSGWVEQYISSPQPALVLQLLLILSVSLLLLLLLKPLLALTRLAQPGMPIASTQEPDLYAFVEEVCEQIGAPAPAEIHLQESAGISVAYYRGPQGWLENRTVLTLGVPLIAALNRSQLAALLASHLSRYRHNAAPRATAILMHGHAWLQATASGEDTIDRALRQWHEDGLLGDALFNFLQILMRPARRMAGWRLRLSRALDRRVVHRIIAEEDDLALAFTGNEGFLRLLDQTTLLTFVSNNLLSGLEERWKSKGVLPGNLVQLLVLRSRQYPSSMPQKLRRVQERKMAATGDILPSDSQRLKRIGNTAINPDSKDLAPASSLFHHYGKLTRFMTLRYYHHRLRLPVSPYQLQQVSGKKSLEHLHQQKLDIYFRKLYVDFLPLKLRQRMRNINTLDEARQQWSVGIARIQSEYEKAKQAKVLFTHTEATLVNASTREAIHLAGLWRQWGEEKLHREALEEVHQSARDSERDHQQALRGLEQYLRAYAMRLSAVLAALNQGEAATLPATMGLKQEAQVLLATLELIDGVQTQLSELQIQTLLLETLLSQRTTGQNTKLNERIEQYAADAQHLTRAISFTLKNAPYPFADGKAKLLLKYVLQDALSEESAQGNLDRGNDTVAVLAQVQRRALIRLIAISGQVEEALGFRPS